MSATNHALDDVLQSLDLLEHYLPTPHISPSDFKSYSPEEMEDVVNEAGEYQKLADILAEHPVIKYILEETKGMSATRA